MDFKTAHLVRARDSLAALNLDSSNRVKFKTTLDHLLSKASAEGDRDTVRSLVRDHGVDINAVDQFGSSALHKAVIRNQEEEICFLLEEMGADVDARAHGGDTPLHNAAQFASPEVCHMLVQRFGADVHAKTVFGHTPLHCAVNASKLQTVIRLLRDLGADVDCKRSDGLRALHQAVFNGDVDLARALTNHGADVNALSDRGRTPLHFVRTLPMARLLVHELGADLSLTDMYGQTPAEKLAEMFPDVSMFCVNEDGGYRVSPNV